MGMEIDNEGMDGGFCLKTWGFLFCFVFQDIPRKISKGYQA